MCSFLAYKSDESQNIFAQELYKSVQYHTVLNMSTLVGFSGQLIKKSISTFATPSVFHSNVGQLSDSCHQRSDGLQNKEAERLWSSSCASDFHLLRSLESAPLVDVPHPVWSWESKSYVELLEFENCYEAWWESVNVGRALRWPPSWCSFWKNVTTTYFCHW